MNRFSLLCMSLFVGLILPRIAWAQNVSSPYLVRLEHQTRDENVCMLVLKNGHYHLERTATGHVRVFEGTLEIGRAHV